MAAGTPRNVDSHVRVVDGFIQLVGADGTALTVNPDGSINTTGGGGGGAGGATEATLLDVLAALVVGPVTTRLLQWTTDSVEAIDSGEQAQFTHVVPSTELGQPTITAAGDNVLFTCPAGQRLQLRWCYAIQDPASTASPLIRVLLGPDEKFCAWALSKRQKVLGPVDGDLVVNLSAGGNVAFTALVEVLP